MEIDNLQGTVRAYVRNIEARSGNYCCRGKTISITFSDCL